MLDGQLRPIGAWRLDARPAVLESSADGLGILIGADAGAQAGIVTWLRRTDGAPLHQTQLPGSVRGLRLDRGGRSVVVLSSGPAGGLTTLSADRLMETQRVPVCSEPVSLGFAPDGDRVYVTCRPGSVVEVDPRLQIVVRRAWVGADSGRACGAGRGDLSANGTLLYVPCARTGRLLYLDRATLKPWDSVAVGAGVAVAAVTPQAIAVTLLPDSNRVALVNLRSKAVMAALTITHPVDVALSADGTLAFVVGAGRDRTEGALFKLDTPTGAELQRAPVPSGEAVVYVWPGRQESRMYWVTGR